MSLPYTLFLMVLTNACKHPPEIKGLVLGHNQRSHLLSEVYKAVGLYCPKSANLIGFPTVFYSDDHARVALVSDNFS